jgi:CDGSH-type Zn-finger protein
MENENNHTNSPEVHIQRQGPIMLKGRFVFRESSGKVTEGEQEIYLCRCGGSKNQPFCDDTHKLIGVAD